MNKFFCSVTYISLILLFFLILIVVVYYLSVSFFEIDISEYEGDGIISVEGKGVIAKGFELRFSKFDMTQPYTQRFFIKKLPRLDKTHWFQINIKKYKGDVSGVIVLKVSSETGENILNITYDLSDCHYHEGKEKDFSRNYYLIKQDIISAVDKVEVESLHKPFFVDLEYSPTLLITEKISGSLIIKSGGNM